MKTFILRTSLATALLISLNAQAEWLGSAGAGLSYSNNYSLQNGNYSNITQSRYSRTGIELSAAGSWQDFKPEGGYSIDGRALLDRSTGSGSRISNLSLSASKILPLSQSWVSRFNGGIIRYRDDDYLQNGYDGLRLEATAGYFSPQGGGADFKLGWIDENHDQDVAASYRTRRTTAAVSWFFATRAGAAQPGVSLAIQQHTSTDARRDALSLLFSASLERIRLGRHSLSLSLNWRQDDYDQPFTTVSTDPGGPLGGNPFGGGMSPGGFPGPGGGTLTSSQPRRDSQLFASASVQHPIGRDLLAALSASAGRYDSSTGSQTFFNLHARLRWFIR